MRKLQIADLEQNFALFPIFDRFIHSFSAGFMLYQLPPIYSTYGYILKSEIVNRFRNIMLER